MVRNDVEAGVTADGFLVIGESGGDNVVVAEGPVGEEIDGRARDRKVGDSVRPGFFGGGGGGLAFCVGEMLGDTTGEGVEGKSLSDAGSLSGIGAPCRRW